MDLTWNWYEETDATKIIERLKWLEGKRSFSQPWKALTGSISCHLYAAK